MGFDYEELKESEQNEQHWATYSDLFMVFSLVFLLLYTVSSLRSGAQNLMQTQEFRQLQAENEELKQELKVYELQKEDYLKANASEDQQKLYSDLMGKINLLQEETSEESDKLRAQALENDEKKLALNKYQKMIKSIINANVLSQAAIEERNRRVEKVRKQSKAKLKKVKTQSAKRIKELKKQSNKIARELLTTEKDLQQIQTNLQQEQAKLLKSKKEKSLLVKKLERSKIQYQAEIDSVKLERKRVQAEMLKESKQQEKAFKRELKKQKLSLKAQRSKLADFKKQAKAERKAQKKMFDKELAGLNNKLSETNSDLVKARKLANARKNLARDIKRAFAKSGLKADVNEKTGDVVINFGDEYFDTGRHGLKNGMKSTLQKFVPLYAKTLFKDKKVAEKIKDVEIIGFASPTYQGRYIDPKSLERKDRKAIEYNLDLSYRRARSIFSFMFDENEMPKYDHQKKLQPLVKVGGRSFLAEKVGRGPASKDMSAAQFCKQYDCKKAQRVIIKFNLED